VALIGGVGQIRLLIEQQLCPHSNHCLSFLNDNGLSLNHHFLGIVKVKGHQLADTLFHHGHAEQALFSLSSALL